MAEETWYTCEQMAAKLLPDSAVWARVQVAVALGMLTRWHIERGDFAPTIDRSAIVRKVRETVKETGRRDHIVADLEQFDFQCQWILYAPFEAEAAGFVLQAAASALT